MSLSGLVPLDIDLPPLRTTSCTAPVPTPHSGWDAVMHHMLPVSGAKANQTYGALICRCSFAQRCQSVQRVKPHAHDAGSTAVTHAARQQVTD